MRASGLDRIDARVLMGLATGRDPAWLVAHGDDGLDDRSATRFEELARRRRSGEPVAYLTGAREFWGLALAVSPAVLIPRPETECLVEAVLAHLPSDRDVDVLDLGTGSGAIALAIARERPRARVVATDRSAEALSIARSNAVRHGLDRVHFVASDWYRDVQARRFDAIVSNPPYVNEGDPHLGQGDLRFEPVGALTPGPDGLAALRVIVGEAPRWMKPGGVLAVEHGHDQGAAVQALFAVTGFTDLRPVPDLAGIARAMLGRWPGPVAAMP